MPVDILDPELLRTSHDIMLQNVLHIVAIALIYYDHILTSGRETDLIWRRPKTRSSYYFLVNRYFSFFGNIAVSVLGFTDLSVQSCKRYNSFRQALLVITQVLICYFLALRIYALYQHSVRILVTLVSTAAILVALSCWSLFGQKSAPRETGSGCHIGMSKSTAIHLAVAWESMFLFESLIFSLTVYHSWRTRRQYFLPGRNVPPLLTLVLRDGVLYFSVMALANLSNILTFYIGGPYFRGGISTLASSVSVTMMSRLMLNLHETAKQGILSTRRASTYGTSYWSGDSVELNTILTANTESTNSRSMGAQGP